MTEPINHYNAVKLRVVGSGNLRLKLSSLDELVEQTLVPLVLSATSSRQPVVLANFMQERASLKIKVTEIDEYFWLGKIIIYVKPTFSSYPQ